MFNWLKKKRRDGHLKYEMTINGHRLYSFKDYNHAPLFRAYATRVAFHNIDLGVKISDLQAFIEVGLSRLNNQDYSSVATLFNVLDLQIKNYASERVMLTLAGPLVIVDDEPLDEMTEKHNRIKEDLLAYPSVRAFFLNIASEYLCKLINSLELSQVQESLNHPQRLPNETIFLASIGRSMYTNLLKP